MPLEELAEWEATHDAAGRLKVAGETGSDVQKAGSLEGSGNGEKGGSRVTGEGVKVSDPEK